jgi:AAA15 family ATPase/GTPase
MNPVIQNLQINSFRGLKGLNLSDLGWVNILVGKNNSGKTTILEAISIACNPLDPFQWIGISERRSSIGTKKSSSVTKPNLEAIKWLFSQFNSSIEDSQYQGTIEISCSANISIEIIAISSNIYADGYESDPEYVRPGIELEVEASIISDRRTDVLKSEDNRKDTFQFWTEERFIQKRGERVKPLINHVTIYPSYSSSDVSLSLRLTQIAKEGTKHQLLQAIQLFDPNILNIEILTTSPNISVLYIQHKQLGFAPFYTFGDGLKKALIIALALPLAKNGILLIDEIETSIHFSALSEIFNWLIETCKINKTQLFVTTHSLEAVDAMLNTDREKEDVVAFRLNSDNEMPQRFSGELLQRLRSNRGLDVR